MGVLEAMIIMTIVSAGTSAIAASSAADERERAETQQENARRDNTRKEIGVAQQRTQTALAGAASRNKGYALPSYGMSNAIGTASATPTNAGSSGTF